MLFGKEFKSIVYLIKKIEFQITTWKNSLDIAFAYKSPSNKNSSIIAIVKKLAIVFSILLLVTGSLFLVFKYQHRITAIFLKIKVKEDVVETITKEAETTGSAEVIETPFSDTMENTEVVEPVETEAETTIADSTPLIEKPAVRKYSIKEENDTSKYFIIVANKAVKSLYLLQYQTNKWNTVKEYDVAIGEQDGKKVHAGDRRTPEGLYFIVGRKERSELSKIYGPLSYVLNYPNKEDRLAGRTGQGIWIHGTDPDSMPIETKGCLELNNDDLKELSQILKKGIGIPVFIVNNPLLSDPTLAPDYMKCEKERVAILTDYHNYLLYFKEFVGNWKTAWETKNIVDYTSFYDTLQFQSQGLDWSGWRERKLRTFSLYDTISITIDNVMITDYSEQSAIMKFNQVYTTNLNSNEVAKKLKVVKVEDIWKIISESTCSKQELLL